MKGSSSYRAGSWDWLTSSAGSSGGRGGSTAAAGADCWSEELARWAPSAAAAGTLLASAVERHGTSACRRSSRHGRCAAARSRRSLRSSARCARSPATEAPRPLRARRTVDIQYSRLWIQYCTVLYDEQNDAYLGGLYERFIRKSVNWFILVHSLIHVLHWFSTVWLFLYTVEWSDSYHLSNISQLQIILVLLNSLLYS